MSVIIYIAVGSSYIYIIEISNQTLQSSSYMLFYKSQFSYERYLSHLFKILSDIILDLNLTVKYSDN